MLMLEVQNHNWLTHKKKVMYMHGHAVVLCCSVYKMFIKYSFLKHLNYIFMPLLNQIHVYFNKTWLANKQQHLDVIHL